MLEGNDIRRGFHEFQLYERGKLRDICSVHYSERVIHKSLSVNALVPALTPSFIRNNTANTKGRGTGDAIARLKRDLAKHYRKHGREGYILLIDFKSYFANIAHEPLKEIVAKSIDDPRIVKLTHDQIDACGEKGLGLGSEPNQILAVAFPSAIDHFVTEMLGVEAYGRYMDDMYIICRDRDELRSIIEGAKEVARCMGIYINDRKTHIVRLSDTYKYLQIKYSLAENGRVIKRINPKAVTRERRRMKAYKRLIVRGEMSYEAAEMAIRSWMGDYSRLMSKKQIQNMKALYRALFGKELSWKPLSNSRTVRKSRRR